MQAPHVFLNTLVTTEEQGSYSLNDASSPGETSSSTTVLAASPPPPFVPAAKDDLDILLQHVDFPRLLTLAAQVKAIRIEQSHAFSSSSTNHKQDVTTAVLRMQAMLISSTTAATSRIATNIARGEYPITDGVMDDALMELQAEIDAHECGIRTTSTTSCSPGVDNPAKTTAHSHSDVNSSSTKKKGDAIAIKYSKWQTDILMNWMIENSHSPFPDTLDVAQLAATTGLTHSQVINWTTNVRKRNLKATCKGHKKPHHFIDFLFLKQHREEQESGFNGSGSNEASPSSLTTPAQSSSYGKSHLAPSSSSSPEQLHHPHHAHYLLTPQPGTGHSVSSTMPTHHLIASGPHPYHNHSPLPPPPPPRLHHHHHHHHQDATHGPLPQTLQGQQDVDVEEEGSVHGLPLTEEDDDVLLMLEPLDVNEVPDPEVLKDFADLWTDMPIASSSSLSLSPSSPQQSFLASCLSSSSLSCLLQPLHHHHGGPSLLLPSVTHDSHDEPRNYSNSTHHHSLLMPKRKRPTTPPPLDEIEVELDVDDDYVDHNNDEYNLTDWDDEVGLTF